MEKRYILSGFLLSFGGKGEADFVFLFFFFKIVATKYVLSWRVLPTKTHPALWGLISFQTKFLFPYTVLSHNFSPRKVNDKWQ